jgi:hypothetical protein
MQSRRTDHLHHQVDYILGDRRATTYRSKQLIAERQSLAYRKILLDRPVSLPQASWRREQVPRPQPGSGRACTDASRRCDDDAGVVCRWLVNTSARWVIPREYGRQAARSKRSRTGRAGDETTRASHASVGAAGEQLLGNHQTR